MRSRPTEGALEPVLTSAVAADEFLHLILAEPDEALDLPRALFERLRPGCRLRNLAGNLAGAS